MTTPEALDNFKRRAIENKLEEPAFFRTLLEATVYAHVPLSDPSGRLRLLQFTRPDGQTVLPFFTTEAQARTAAKSAARIVALYGRQLMELTRGAVLMLDPNDYSCTLYPEEIAVLLATGHVGPIQPAPMPAGSPMWVGETEDPPAWMIDTLTELYARLPFVESGYLLQIAPPDQPDQLQLLLVIRADAPHQERAARDTIAAIQQRCHELDKSLDVTVHNSAEPTASMLAGSAPFYARSWGSRLGASDGMQPQ